MKNVKGIFLNAMLLLLSLAVSVLSFTTNCNNTYDLAHNPYFNITGGINSIEYASRGVSVGLIAFTMAIAVMERHLTNTVDFLKNENEELKTQISQTNRNEDLKDEPLNSKNAPDDETPKSIVTHYPKIIRYYP